VLVRDTFDEPEALPEFGIAHASYLLLSLAKKIYDDLGWDGVDDIDELVSMIEGWKPGSPRTHRS